MCVQKLEQENQDLGKKLSEKEEESSRLKDHNQNLLTQIKKLKNDKKSLENKLEQLIEKEALKSSDVEVQVVEKGTNTDPIHITTQEGAKSVQEKTFSDVEEQTMGIRSILTNKNSTINKATPRHEEEIISKVNQENATSTIRENHVTRTPYRHPNHKSRYLNQSEYQYHSRWKQLTYLSKNIDTNTIKSHDNNSSWKRNVLQMIELGWSDPFTVRQFCSALRGSYRLVSSTMTTPRTKNDAKTLQAKEKDVKPFHKYALRTKHFKRGRQCNKYKYKYH
jgi:hypothetical protein